MHKMFDFSEFFAECWGSDDELEIAMRHERGIIMS